MSEPEGAPQASGKHSEPEGRGAAWTEERGTSDEGRRCHKSAPQASGKHCETDMCAPGVPARAGGSFVASCLELMFGASPRDTACGMI